VNANLRRQLRKRNQILRNRIDKRKSSCSIPAIRPSVTKLELSEKSRAISCGGIAMIMPLLKQLELRKNVNEYAPVFKVHAPYDEADHIFNIALNLLAGGTCLDHLEIRRTDEAFLDAIGAARIPDPTTAGDFCRRFDASKILDLMKGINQSRMIAWRQQPDDFFDQATIEADGTMVETEGQKKEGIGMNYKGQWGYHPLVVTLAETQELLYLENRSGNRPSHENAAKYFDLAIADCREAGFRKIVIRGDTDFALTANFDRWDDAGVEFSFGTDASQKLTEIADSLEESQWNPLDRSKQASEKPRQKRPNYKEKFVEQKGYENQKLRSEWYAEFNYQPGKCDRNYRVVVVYKEIDVMSGQEFLFEKDRYFFYITNACPNDKPARQVVAAGNKRCNQENTISQLKACHALEAPLGDLNSNWAYMVIASLAWNLKCWSGIMVRVTGNKHHRAKQCAVRRRIIKMEFATYLNTLIQIPAQVIRSARTLTLRLLTYRDSVDCLMMLHDHISRPLRS
jgi:hypothetical protein